MEINHCALEQSFKQLVSPPSPKAKPETDQSLSPLRVINKRHTTGLRLDVGMEYQVKMKMREWATAVASNNEAKANLKVSEILLTMDNHRMRGK